MPLYFFHLDAAVPFLDEEGTELLDDAAARIEAAAMAGELLRDMAERFWKVPRVSLRVLNAGKQSICSLQIQGVVDHA